MTDSQTMPADPSSAEAIPDEIAIQATKQATADVQTFADFAIHPDIVGALAAHGITTPFPIQAMTLPVALSGHDIIGQAKTGTGKTLGFGIPLLNKVLARGDAAWEGFTHQGKPQALAVAPTRELALQVPAWCSRLGHRVSLRPRTFAGSWQSSTVHAGVRLQRP